MNFCVYTQTTSDGSEAEVRHLFWEQKTLMLNIYGVMFQISWHIVLLEFNQNVQSFCGKTLSSAFGLVFVRLLWLLSPESLVLRRLTLSSSRPVSPSPGCRRNAAWRPRPTAWPSPAAGRTCGRRAAAGSRSSSATSEEEQRKKNGRVILSPAASGRSGSRAFTLSDNTLTQTEVNMLAGLPLTGRLRLPRIHHNRSSNMLPPLSYLTG